MTGIAQARKHAANAKCVDPNKLFKLLVGGTTFSHCLNLTKAGDELFASPQLVTWEKYVKEFATVNPDDKTTLISTMTSHYGDKGVYKILESAKKVPSTETLATALQAEQLNPQFSTWITISDEFYTKNPGKKVSTMWVLNAHYSDDALARMILAAEKVPSTKGVARRVEDEMFKNWMGTQLPTTPDEAFKLLKLDKAENVLETTTTKPSSKLLLQQKNLRAPRRSENLQAEQFKGWLADKESPDAIFELLKLDKAGKDLLANSRLNTWVTYLGDYNKQPFAKKTTMIGTFTKHFGDEALAQMLTTARSVPRTKKMAGFLYGLKRPNRGIALPTC
ncbi:unnamed protein product [Phytophthora lilii]|uniref:Unnamed protein product n=1 Tax=Phytophthora lilii TaxID=2077276 RepID=A0A9W6TZD3_9STRA|nr:unnamed protein product [Phytophthora lilii]